MSARKPAVIFIFVTLLLDVLGFGLLIPVAPRLVMMLQANHGLVTTSPGDAEAAAAPVVAWLGTTYALMQFLFAPVLGALSDRYGRRPVLLSALFGSGIDYFAMALAPSVPWLFVTRAINGLSGASMATANAYIADVTPPQKRAAAFGMIGAAFGLGFTIGPLMGGLLGAHELHLWKHGPVWHGDIRYPFYAAGIITLINWLYGFFVVPESLDRAHRSHGFDRARANPVGALHGLRRYPFVFVLAGSFFLFNAAQFALHSTWILYTAHRYGWDTFHGALSLFFVGVCAIVVQGGLTRRLIPAMGEPRALIVGLGMSVCAFVGYALATQGWMIYATIVATSLGGIAMPAAQALITHRVSPREQGRVQGALTSVQNLAAIVGPLIGGYVFAFSVKEGARFHVDGLVYFTSAALALVGLLIAIFAVKRRLASLPEAGVGAEGGEGAAASTTAP
ncbi:MAG: TCR/Tet family MFS transporter [Phycisphaerales bacterium]